MRFSFCAAAVALGVHAELHFSIQPSCGNYRRSILRDSRCPLEPNCPENTHSASVELTLTSRLRMLLFVRWLLSLCEGWKIEKAIAEEKPTGKEIALGQSTQRAFIHAGMLFRCSTLQVRLVVINREPALALPICTSPRGSFCSDLYR